jgi:phosphate transport system permease protein
LPAARAAALLTLALLLGILMSLLIGAWPAIERYGLSFLVRSQWDPVAGEFGGLVMIYGTLATSAIALLIAVPVSFGIALFLTELSPAWLKRPLGTAIELLAAVPSIVYGMWGLMVFGPMLATCAAAAAGALPGRAVSGRAGLGPAGGHRHPVGRHHPGHHDHSLHRLGDARRVRGHPGAAQGVGLRPGRDHLGSGVEGGAALHQDRRAGRRHAGPGPRAGRDHGRDLRDRQHEPAQSLSLFEAANSITSALANEFAEAGEGLHQASLIYLGLVLFFITFVVLALSKLLLGRLKKNEGGRA